MFHRREIPIEAKTPPTKTFFPRASNILKFVALRVVGNPSPPQGQKSNASVRGGGPRQKRHSARGAAAQDAAPSSDPQRGRGATAFEIKKCNITRKKDESKNKKKTTRTLRVALGAGANVLDRKIGASCSIPCRGCDIADLFHFDAYNEGPPWGLRMSL